MIKYIGFLLNFNNDLEDLDECLSSTTYGRIYVEWLQIVPTFVDGIATIDMTTNESAEIGSKYKLYPNYVHAIFGSSISRYIAIIGAGILEDGTTIQLRAVNLEATEPVGINTSSFYVKILYFKYKI